jgi:predicted YcjX-like family ATPase
MKHELKVLIDQLEKLNESMDVIKDMESRIGEIEKFINYLKGMMVVGAVIAASYGYMLFEIIKKVL